MALAFASPDMIAAAPATVGQRDTSRWTLCFGVAIAAHLGLAAALISRHFEAPPLPPALVMLDMAPLPQLIEPPLPAPPELHLPPPPPPPPPEHEPIPEIPEVTVPVQPVVTIQKPPPKPKLKKPPPPPEVQQLVPPQPQEAPAPRPRVEAPPPPAPTPIAAPVTPTFQSQLLAHLQRHKRYPNAARVRGQQGVALVRFIMDRNGKVLSCRLERGSGHSLLDEEVLAMLERAQPLPPIPPEMPDQQLEFVVPIHFGLR